MLPPGRFPIGKTQDTTRNGVDSICLLENHLSFSEVEILCAPKENSGETAYPHLKYLPPTPQQKIWKPSVDHDPSTWEAEAIVLELDSLGSGLEYTAVPGLGCRVKPCLKRTGATRWLSKSRICLASLTA